MSIPPALHEYSVVFNDRALNHMSAEFQQVMRDISDTLKSVYGGAAVAVVPGGGSFGMEAVARQLATGQHCLVLRNGWFSYRWSQIFDAGAIPASSTVLSARPLSPAQTDSAWVPAPLAEVLAAIARERPALVFAPHVETAAGMILPDDYLRAVADAVHAVGGLLVLDCIASGALWPDMSALGIDVLISAPQKGWSASPCSALIVLSEEALARVQATQSSSFAADLRKWQDIMAAYERGGHAYHATMPTDALRRFRDAMQETVAVGLAELSDRQWQLGRAVRTLFADHGHASVADSAFAAPGVVVLHTRRDGLHNGRDFLRLGLQTAAGVPLMCGEPPDFKTFRVGLFGLDKLFHIERTVDRLAQALSQLETPHAG